MQKEHGDGPNQDMERVAGLFVRLHGAQRV